jgi:hypothetical protein
MRHEFNRKSVRSTPLRDFIVRYSPAANQRHDFHHIPVVESGLRMVNTTHEIAIYFNRDAGAW